MDPSEGKNIHNVFLQYIRTFDVDAVKSSLQTFPFLARGITSFSNILNDKRFESTPKTNVPLNKNSAFPILVLLEADSSNVDFTKSKRNEIIKLLLDHGASPNQFQHNNLTPMHLIAISHSEALKNQKKIYSEEIKVEDDVEDTELVELLFQNGADLSLMDVYNRNPFFYASGNVLSKLIELNKYRGLYFQKDLYHRYPFQDVSLWDAKIWTVEGQIDPDLVRPIQELKPLADTIPFQNKKFPKEYFNRYTVPLSIEANGKEWEQLLKKFYELKTGSGKTDLNSTEVYMIVEPDMIVEQDKKTQRYSSLNVTFEPKGLLNLEEVEGTKLGCFTIDAFIFFSVLLKWVKEAKKNTDQFKKMRQILKKKHNDPNNLEEKEYLAALLESAKSNVDLKITSNQESIEKVKQSIAECKSKSKAIEKSIDDYITQDRILRNRAVLWNPGEPDIEKILEHSKLLKEINFYEGLIDNQISQIKVLINKTKELEELAVRIQNDTQKNSTDKNIIMCLLNSLRINEELVELSCKACELIGWNENLSQFVQKFLDEGLFLNHSWESILKFD
jgi:hypothetical protein